MYMPQLTETVRTIRKDHPGAFRYKWEFSDGPARFEEVFIDRVSHVDPEDGRPCAVLTVIQILSDESEGRIWSHQYQVKRARNGMLYSNPYLDADYASLKVILQIRSSGGKGTHGKWRSSCNGRTCPPNRWPDDGKSPRYGTPRSCRQA